MKLTSRLRFGDTHASPTALPLQTLWLLSVLVFLINYTFEVLDFNHLYESQQFLLVLTQLILSLWALIGVVPASVRARRASVWEDGC